MTGDHRLTAIVAVSRPTVAHALRLAAAWPGSVLYLPRRWIESATPATPLPDSLKEAMPGLFRSHDKLVFFLATGAVVRLIAPLLNSKFDDPAIVVVDGAARFAIALLSGHLGGANDLARAVGEVLHAQPIITTASDATGVFAVDLLGKERGWQVEATPEAQRRAAAHMVNGDPVALVMETWLAADYPPLPAHVTRYSPAAVAQWRHHEVILWVTRRPRPAIDALGLKGTVVLYRPPAALMLGLGCDRNTSRQEIATAITAALHAHDLSMADILAVATIDLKGDEPGILQVMTEQGWPLHLFDAATLDTIPVPHPSETVRRHTGTGSVAEAAALLLAQQGQEALVIRKFCHRGADGRNVTVAAARIGS